MQEENKKKPFAVRLLSGLFKAVAFLLLLVVMAAVGAGIFVKVKYDVNVLALIGEMKSLSENSGKDIVVTNEFTDEDLTSYEVKEATLVANPITRFTDKEVGAKLAKLIETSSDVNLAFGNNDLEYLGVEIVQVLFKNIPETQPSDNLADINVVVHLNMRKFKEDNFSKFPQSMLKNMVPDDIYASCTSTVIKDAENGYKITQNVLTINALNAEDTANIFKVINMFNPSFGQADEIADSLGTSVVDAILGTNGVVGTLKEIGLRDYVFKKSDTSNDLVVYTIDTTTTRTITYNNLYGADNSENITTYNITYDIILKDIERNGYHFDGWYSDSLFVNKVETLDANLMQDFVVYAKWTAVNYTITLDLNGGTIAGETTITYNIETESFTLNKPTKTVGGITLEFNGWLGTGVEEITNNLTITKGSYGDKTFKAYYIGETAVVTVYVDGVFRKTITENIGTKLNEDTLVDFAEIGLSGYEVSTWYTNEEQTTEFDFDEVLEENVNLYGTSEYIVKLLLFPKYFDKFEAARSSENLTVNSRDELRAYVDYVLFYEITDNVTITLNYTFSDSSTEIQSAITYVTSKNTQREGYSYSGYPVQFTSNKVKMTCSNSTFLDTPTLVADQEKAYTYTQQDYGLKLEVESTRTAETTFKVDNGALSIPVSTSSQLVFALESGAVPVCEVGSAAEDIYNKAKAVLRQICDDSMDDVTKLRAIYEWLILNVQYDNYAASHALSNAKDYDSWAAEGVFNNGKAVCEGYAKALIIMARIEGIPAIFVSGNGHAWNRVYVDGAWYVVDATHGNPLNTTMKIETTTYGEFMITDAEKTNHGYTGTNYTEFAATTEYNYYSDYQDLTIGSSNELKLIFIAAKNSADLIDSAYTTVDVYVLAINKSSFENVWMSSARVQAGVALYSGYFMTQTESGDYIYTILIVK